MNRIIGYLMFACIICTPAFGTVIYSNTTTDTLDTLPYEANGFTQIGDQIHLDGTDRQATLATVQFYNSGTAGTFDATLRFFDVGSPVGSQIGSDFLLNGIAAPLGGGATGFNVAFALPNLVLPDDVIFTVSIANPSDGVSIIGLDLFGPPTTGSSDSTFAIAHNGTSFAAFGTDHSDLFFELQATSVPEPATTGIVGAGLLGLALLRRPRMLAMACVRR